MDFSMVASYVGTLSFMVSLNNRPFFFSKLSKKTLETYPYTFRISVEEFTDIERLKQKHAG